MSRFGCPCCGVDFTDPKVRNLVEEIERDEGILLAVTSACRCETHNRKVNGSPTSSHLLGLAVDIAAGDSRLRYRLVTAALRRGVTRIGIGKNFIHLDVDPGKDRRVIWLY